VELFVNHQLAMSSEGRRDLPIMIEFGIDDYAKHCVGSKWKHFNAGKCNCFHACDEERIIRSVCPFNGGVNAFNLFVQKMVEDIYSSSLSSLHRISFILPSLQQDIYRISEGDDGDAVARFRCVSWDVLTLMPKITTGAGQLDGQQVSTDLYVCQTRASLENAMFSCRTRGTTMESRSEMHCTVGAKFLELPMNVHQSFGWISYASTRQTSRLTVLVCLFS
jgi:hypothetical protein